MTELLGDKVERVLSNVGIKAKKGCGCKRRKEFLNKMHQQMQNMRDRILEQQNKNLKR